MLIFSMSAWMPDDKARAFASDVRDAIDATITRKEAWSLMRLANEGDLSAQLNCQKPLNAFRLMHLPDPTIDVLLSKMSDRRGGMYLSPRFVVLLHGAAAMGNRQMVRMGLPQTEQERVS